MAMYTPRRPQQREEVILEPCMQPIFRTHTLGYKLPSAVIGEKIRQSKL